MLSSVTFPKYDCMMVTILVRNSKTRAALTFCLEATASQTLDRLMWKKLVLAMLVTGERTCCLAWITFTRNASTAFLLHNTHLHRLNLDIITYHIYIWCVHLAAGHAYVYAVSLPLYHITTQWNILLPVSLQSGLSCAHVRPSKRMYVPNIISVHTRDQDLAFMVVNKQPSNHCCLL